MSQETAKWYVIHTYAGYEALVKDSLEKLIENMKAEVPDKSLYMLPHSLVLRDTTGD